MKKNEAKKRIVLLVLLREYILVFSIPCLHAAFASMDFLVDFNYLEEEEKKKVKGVIFYNSIKYSPLLFIFIVPPI